MIRWICAVSLALWMSPPPLWADSDGYYCTTVTYLAYELRFTSGPDHQPPNGHTLFIVRLGDARSPQPIAIRLPDFQVHGMRCADTAVELAGWDMVYIVDVGHDEGLNVRAVLPRAKAGGAPGGFVQTNLAAWAAGVRQGSSLTRIQLPASIPGVTQSLEIHFGPHPSGDRCRYQVTTYLRSATSGADPGTMLLAAADFRRDCH
jgi:hypothetical protein